MVLSRDGARLFVACANTNAVWVVDVADTNGERADFGRARRAGAGRDRRRTACRCRPTARTLLIANADNNTVAVVDVVEAGMEPGRGLRPGRLVSDRRRSSIATGPRFFVLDGKGLASSAEHRAARSPAARGSTASTPATCSRARSRPSRCPTAAALARYSKQVRELTPYSDAHRLDAGRCAARRRRSRAASATARRSSTCSTSFARTAPTTRSSATCRRRTAIRRWRCSART